MRFKIYLLLFCFIGLSVKSFATAYINLNIADTSFCITELNHFFKVTSFDSVRIVLPEEVSSVKLKALSANSKVKLIYRNSLVDYLSKSLEGAGRSTFCIINSKGSIIYKAPLRKINYKAIQYFTQYDQAPVFDSTIDNIKMLGLIQKRGDNIMLTEGVRNPFIGKMSTKGFIPIEMTEKLLSAMYKVLYDKKFDKKYPAMRTYLYGHKGVMPAAESSLVLDDTTVLVQYMVKDMNIAQDGTEVIRMHEMFVLFNTDSLHKFAIYKMPSRDSLHKNNIWERGLVRIKGELFQRYVLDINKEDRQELLSLQLNQKTQTIELGTKRYTRFVPEGYLNRVSSPYHSRLSVTDETIVYAYADSMYDFELNKMISVPFKATNMQPGDETYIWTGMKNPYTKNYHIVYTQESDEVVHNMIFDKKGRLISEHKVLGSNKKYSYSSTLIHPYQLLRFNKKENKFEPFDL